MPTLKIAKSDLLSRLQGNLLENRSVHEVTIVVQTFCVFESILAKEI